MTPPGPLRVDFSKYNSGYTSGKSKLTEALWFFLGLPLLRCAVIPSSSFRAKLLRLFGASIGKMPTIKPGFRVKYPWLLIVGDYCWLGEDAWIDNLALVTIGTSVCVSQNVYLCTGNHNWSDPSFGLIVQPITLQDGSWAGAGCTVGPGVEFGEGAVAAAGSVVLKSLSPWTIYAGNPAVAVRARILKVSSVEH